MMRGVYFGIRTRIIDSIISICIVCWSDNNNKNFDTRVERRVLQLLSGYLDTLMACCSSDHSIIDACAGKFDYRDFRSDLNKLIIFWFIAFNKQMPQIMYVG